MIFRNHGAGEIECRPGNVRVDIYPAGKNHHARRIDRTATIDLGNDSAVGDADVSNFTVNVVGGIVNFAAGDAKHERLVNLMRPKAVPIAMNVYAFLLVSSPLVPMRFAFFHSIRESMTVSRRPSRRYAGEPPRPS